MKLSPGHHDLPGCISRDKPLQPAGQVKVCPGQARHLLATDISNCGPTDYTSRNLPATDISNCGPTDYTSRNLLATDISNCGPTANIRLPRQEVGSCSDVPTCDLCNDEHISTSLVSQPASGTSCSRKGIGDDNSCGCCIVEQGVPIRCSHTINTRKFLTEFIPAPIGSCSIKTCDNCFVGQLSDSCSCPSHSQSVKTFPGAYCQDVSPKSYMDLNALSYKESKKVTRQKRRTLSSHGLYNLLDTLAVSWKVLLMLLLLPGVLSRETPGDTSTADLGITYAFGDPNTTLEATVVPSSQGKLATSSQNLTPPERACSGDACSKPAALEDAEESDSGGRSVHMERIKMMMIPIVTVAAAAAVLVTTYYICRYKKCSCCQRQLDKCNSICDRCMRGDFGESPTTGVVIDENGEMEALDGGSVTPIPGSGDSAQVRAIAHSRPVNITVGRGTGKSHSAMYIFRQPSHSGSVSSSRGRLSKSLQHVESTSSQQRKVARGSRGSLQSSSMTASLSVPPASRTESIHRLLGGPPRTQTASASRSTSFSGSAKNQPGQQGGSNGNKGQASVSTSRQSSVRSLAPSAQGDTQDVPKGFIPPMRPY